MPRTLREIGVEVDQIAQKATSIHESDRVRLNTIALELYTKEHEGVRTNRVDKTLSAIKAEMMSASEKYPRFHSVHEGYAVLLEEVEELWDEIKKKRSKRDTEAMRAEAIQVAAMSVRFIYDLLDDDHSPA